MTGTPGDAPTTSPDDVPEMDALFVVAPAEFVAARNALAAKLKAAGRREAAARVKALARPSPSAWAVNGLYWRARDFLERLLDAGEDLRAAQESGDGESLREAMRARRDALGAARDRTLSFLRQAGQAVTPAVEQRISNTLLALATHGRRTPDEVFLGRLQGDLEPPGFEALAGLTLKEPPAPAVIPRPAPAAAESHADDASQAASRAPTPAPEAEARRRQAEREARQAERARLAAQAEQRRSERDAARRAAGAARAAAETARQKAEGLRHELARAEDALRAADDDAQRAALGLAGAETALAAAEQALGEIPPSS